MRSKLLDEAQWTADCAAKLLNAVASLQIRIASPPMQQDIHSKREETRTDQHEKKQSNMAAAITRPSRNEDAKQNNHLNQHSEMYL
jgi:hypothetical protein